jgi:hypothetical protein
MLGSRGHLLVSCHWPDSLRERSTKCFLCIIDQTSLRTKGTVVVFWSKQIVYQGVYSMYVHIYILLIQTISHPLIGQIEGEVREMEQVWAKVSDHVSYAQYYTLFVRKVWRHLHAILKIPFLWSRSLVFYALTLWDRWGKEVVGQGVLNMICLPGPTSNDDTSSFIKGIVQRKLTGGRN